MSTPAQPAGRLVLMPNTLDLGHPGEPAPLDHTLPRGVIERAARLGHWLAENAKSARAFLKRVDALVPLAQTLQTTSIRELPRPPKGGPSAPSGMPAWPEQLLRDLLAPALAGHDLGLISEAGLPAVADPGAVVVRAAHDVGIEVVALPGPSALTLAMAASGLNGQQFAFVGYLPASEPARTARLRELEALSRRMQQAQLFIETPYRNQALWQALLAGLQPATRVHVSCGLTLEGAFTRTLTVERWRKQPLALPTDVPAVFALQAM